MRALESGWCIWQVFALEESGGSRASNYAHIDTDRTRALKAFARDAGARRFRHASAQPS